METIKLLNGEKISMKLFDKIMGAMADDIDYQEELVSSHPEQPEKKIGYRPVLIRGEVIPPFLVVTFVKGTDYRGEYYYLVNTLLNTEYEVASEKEAKESVLMEIRRLIGR